MITCRLYFKAGMEGVVHVDRLIPPDRIVMPMNPHHPPELANNFFFECIGICDNVAIYLEQVEKDPAGLRQR